MSLLCPLTLATSGKIMQISCSLTQQLLNAEKAEPNSNDSCWPVFVLSAKRSDFLLVLKTKMLSSAINFTQGKTGILTRLDLLFILVTLSKIASVKSLLCCIVYFFPTLLIELMFYMLFVVLDSYSINNTQHFMILSIPLFLCCWNTQQFHVVRHVSTSWYAHRRWLFNHVCPCVCTKLAEKYVILLCQKL